VLDTIRVSAAMTRGADEGGFEQRRRSSGSGRFVTQQDIERRSPIETSEIFNAVPGMHPGFEMRSSFSGPVGSGSLPRCTPNVFIDGRPMPQPGSAGGSPIDELNSWIRVSEISSIEIYPDVPPPQFQVALNGCGSVVFWTKRRVPVRKPPE